MRLLSVLLTVVIVSLATVHSAEVRLLHKDAVVWSQTQVVRGKLTPVFSRSGTLLLNGTPYPVAIPSPGDSFSVSLTLPEGKSTIVALFDSGGTVFRSDTLRYTLGFRVRPEIFAYATVSGHDVALHSSVVENPDSSALTYLWSQDASNPEQISLGSPSENLATCIFPARASAGEYYFTVRVYSSHHDTTFARTFVTVDSTGITPFNLATDHARWIDSAILYETSPYFFVENGQYSDITEKIPELAALGITAIWLQPVMETIEPYQGYHTTDYFRLRTDLGSEEDFEGLIRAAHARGLKVMLDIVPNHTSIEHPYAKDAIQYGPLSHYYDFYQRVKDTSPYSSDYNVLTRGAMTFIYYYWPTLPNLNYDSAELQRMITEAGRYWIERFDIDGYRVDVAWGINARKPDFMTQWRMALKRVKPEVFLLAEDLASNSMVFDRRFDAAYDWRSLGRSALSGGLVLGDKRSQRVRNYITNWGAGFDPMAIILRYLENNDVDRFVAGWGHAITEIIATLSFTLQGIPMLYNGQEVGTMAHPYTGTPIFQRHLSIRSLDQYDLFPFYQRLARMRRSHPSLMGRNYAEVPVQPGANVFVYRRWAGKENVFVVLNLADSATTALLQLPVDSLGVDPARTYYLTDLLTGQYYASSGAQLGSVTVEARAQSAQVLYLGDAPVAVSVPPSASADAEVPADYRLSQNFPNPFNPTTTISIAVPKSGPIRLDVFDLLGRHVSTLAAGNLRAGEHRVDFHAGGLSSGMYIYRLIAPGKTLVRTMILLK
jgi:cyclomaltodextrinase / maltogenic alpha-amylase / neopullulanase